VYPVVIITNPYIIKNRRGERYFSQPAIRINSPSMGEVSQIKNSIKERLGARNPRFPGVDCEDNQRKIEVAG
jgi:hypothetical protein